MPTESGAPSTSSRRESGLPNLGGTFAHVLQRVPEAHRPLLIAVAERLAAERYRGWAQEPSLADHAPLLLACARREEEIATRVEALFPRAAEIQRAMLEKNPDFLEINRSVFAGRPLPEQFGIQAQGERLGASTWRALARKEESRVAREVYLACAELEQASAVVLEAIL
ncbi:MAG TPA: hypothetical protein VII72_02590 [Myxococcota bacterium]|jgi:hypothetical protein